jgi:hypothetical protein
VQHEQDPAQHLPVGQSLAPWVSVRAVHLLACKPSGVLRLNWAVAVAMVDGAGTALALVDTLVTDPALTCGHRAWSVHADLPRRLGERGRAAEDYDRPRYWSTTTSNAGTSPTPAQTFRSTDANAGNTFVSSGRNQQPLQVLLTAAG